MTKNIAKKTIILYVLKMLYQASSEDKPVTLTQMAHVINSLGVSCNRKTVARNVQYMIDFGLPIYKKNGRNAGYYYEKEKDNFFRSIL
jgi:hypothetical protein